MKIPWDHRDESPVNYRDLKAMKVYAGSQTMEAATAMIQNHENTGGWSELGRI